MPVSEDVVDEYDAVIMWYECYSVTVSDIDTDDNSHNKWIKYSLFTLKNYISLVMQFQKVKRWTINSETSDTKNTRSY